MEDIFKNKAKHVKHITLTESERALMFTNISSHMKSGVRTQPTPVLSPWSIFMHKSAVAFVIIAFVFSGATVVVASEDSLPGDLLYPIKVHIKEPVVSVVSFGTHAKLHAEIQKADERLIEAEKLSETGRLSADVRKDIEVRFEKHVEKVNAFVEADDNGYEDVDTKKNIEVREDLDKKVVEHVEKLDKVKEILPEEKKNEIEEFKYNVLQTVLEKHANKGEGKKNK